jgi:hypothetical protein
MNPPFITQKIPQITSLSQAGVMGTSVHTQEEYIDQEFIDHLPIAVLLVSQKS